MYHGTKSLRAISSNMMCLPWWCGHLSILVYSILFLLGPSGKLIVKNRTHIEFSQNTSFCMDLQYKEMNKRKEKEKQTNKLGEHGLT